MHLMQNLSMDTTLTESYQAWLRQPFMFSVATTDVNDEYLYEVIELQQSQVQQ